MPAPLYVVILFRGSLSACCAPALLYIRGEVNQQMHARCATLLKRITFPPLFTAEPENHTPLPRCFHGVRNVMPLGVCTNCSHENANPSVTRGVLTRERHGDSFISISSHLIWIWRRLIPQVVQLSSFILSCEITTQAHKWLEANKDVISLPFACHRCHICRTVKSKHRGVVLTCTLIEVQLALKS